MVSSISVPELSSLQDRELAADERRVRACWAGRSVPHAHRTPEPSDRFPFRCRGCAPETALRRKANFDLDARCLAVQDNFERESALLNVTLDGKASLLFHSSNPELWAAIPSPNGRLVAIPEAGGPKNVWQIENF